MSLLRILLPWLFFPILFPFPACLIGQEVSDSTDFYFRKGELFIGVDALSVGWEGVVQRGESLVSSYTLGVRGGIFLEDGWAIGASWTEAGAAPMPPMQPEQLQWSIFSVFTRYVIRAHPKWSPFTELAWSYAAAFHSDPNLRTGAGAALLPLLGVAFRINGFWSAEIGARGVFTLGGGTGFANFIDNAAGVRPKAALTIHFGRAARP